MEINETIRNFIVSELLSRQTSHPLTDDDQLIDAGIIDSFGIMALIGFLEETFAIRVTSEELLPENFETVGRISTLVAQKTAHSLES